MAKGRETYRKIITSEELINQINSENVKLMDRFLKNFATKRSPKSVVVYRSNLTMFFCWCVDNVDNKAFTELRKIEILDFFDLSRYFEVIVGSELDGIRSAKGEVIAEVLKQMKIEKKDQCVMIGDRKHDLIGASENGIDSIGVTYGYGSQQELEDANATYIVHSVDSLSIIFGE